MTDDLKKDETEASADDEQQRLEDIRKAVEERVQAESSSYPDIAKNNGVLKSAFLWECLHAGELGDGVLYTQLLKDKFLYNVTAKEWMQWTGQYWAWDDHKQAFAGVEVLVTRLLEEADKIKKQLDWVTKKKDDSLRKRLEGNLTSIYKRISKWRTDTGRNPVLKFAVSCNHPITVEDIKFDRKPMLFGCVNGVIDLETGKFRDGRPSDYISKVSPIPWMDYKEPAPRFMQFLHEIFMDDEEIVDFVLKLLGYAITGLHTEHIMPVFWGRGRNGKGTLVKVLNYVLGPMAGNIHTEMLLQTRLQRNPASPSPEILDLKGLRMAFAAETEEGQRFSAAKIKYLTGADQLVGRGLQEKRLIRFDPTHTIFLSTNSKPIVEGDDYAFWKRLMLIPFKLSFIDEEPKHDFERAAIKDLEDELIKEAPGILALLVRSCIAYQKKGLVPPEAVREATLEYQRDEDILGQFVEAYCNEMAPSVKTLSSEIFDKFLIWYKRAISTKGISQKRFGTMMTKRFEKSKSSGITYYHGIEVDAEKADDLREDQG